jgi:curved DNA-binding protein CbpA
VASYYEMLDVVPTAPADEIKRAFRREITKYHPDKVQHLGREFQEIAAVKAAELTQAYKTLSDESLRADYDAQLKAPETVPGQRGAPPPQSEPTPPRGRSYRVGTSDVMRKAALQRFRHAVNQEFGTCEETPIAGFDLMCAPAKSGFLNRVVPPRLLARVVEEVDAAAVQESWTLAMRLRKEDQRDACLFIMGPSLAPAGELGRAINEQRRRPMPPGLKLVVVPVNTRTWSAHIPTDAPAQVKTFLTRLASGL